MTAAVPQVRRARSRGVLALLALVLCLLVTGAPSTAHGDEPTPAAQEEASDVAVRLTSMSPTVVRPGDTLTVVAEVENTTAEEITTPVATLSVSKIPYATRDRLAAWAELGPMDGLGTLLQRQALDAPLAPGATASVTFTVEADSMGLLGTLEWWGPRGISVALSDETAAPRAPLGVLRSYLLWLPVDDSEVTPVSVSVAVPLVGPAFDPLAPDASAGALEEATTQGGRLSKVLASTEGTPGVAWAVDPALVVPVPSRALSVSAGSATATAWAQRVLDGSEGREVAALPVYDQDVAALAAAGAPLPAPPALPAAAGSWRTDLAWPVEESPAAETLALAARSGATNVVVAPGSLAPDRDLTYTPTGKAVVPTTDGPVTALVPDAVLSAELTSPTGTTAAAARQRMLAELAVISRERPAEARHVLLTVPRDWDPTPATARAQLSPLADTPWTTLAPLSTLVGAQDPAVSRTHPGSTTTPQGAVTGAMLDELASVRATVETVARVTPNPLLLTAPADAAALAATSVAWRDDPTGRGEAVSRLATVADDLRHSIQVVSASDYTLIASGSELPVTVSSSLEQDATVRIRLDPDDRRLVAENDVTVTVPAGGEVRQGIPVSAVGSGNVLVTVQILSPDGTVLNADTSFQVRVRADWENLGTAVVAGLLVLLLGAGIWRTIHRGRSDRRASGQEIELLEKIDEAADQAALAQTRTDGAPPAETSEPAERAARATDPSDDVAPTEDGSR